MLTLGSWDPDFPISFLDIFDDRISYLNISGFILESKIGPVHFCTKPIELSSAGRKRPSQLLRHRDGLIGVHVLDGVKQLDAVGHGALESLAAGDQAHAAGALVDDRGLGRVGEVARPGGLPAGVDETRAAHVAAHDLIPGQVDGVVAGQLLVDELAGLAEVEGREPAVVGRLLLLDDVSLDGHAEVIGLVGQVGGRGIIRPVLLERAIPKIAPQHRDHAQLVGDVEGLGHFLKSPA